MHTCNWSTSGGNPLHNGHQITFCMGLPVSTVSWKPTVYMGLNNFFAGGWGCYSSPATGSLSVTVAACLWLRLIQIKVTPVGPLPWADQSECILLVWGCVHLMIDWQLSTCWGKKSESKNKIRICQKKFENNNSWRASVKSEKTRWLTPPPPGATCTGGGYVCWRGADRSGAETLVDSSAPGGHHRAWGGLGQHSQSTLADI